MSSEPDLESLTARLVGTVIDGKYQVERLLGEGGMGAVYRVRHLGLRRDLALKVLRPELVAHAEIAARFDREAHSAARLEHPNCLQVTDFGTTDDGLKYIVMQLLSGHELTDLLTAPLPAPRAIALSLQILRGLEHAHERGVVHRDLKPENVFVTTDHEGRELLKLVDFGIAKLLEGGADEARSPQLTRVGMVFGTPAYMSPEQAAGGHVDHRSDLYAVGIMLYRMLAGDVPFRADDLITVLRQQIAVDPPPLSAEVPAPLRAIVERLLQKDRDDRYGSALEVCDALQAVEAQLVPHPVGRAPGLAVGPSAAGPSPGPAIRSAPITSVTVAPVAPATLAPLSPVMPRPAWNSSRVLKGLGLGVALGLVLLAVLTHEGAPAGSDEGEAAAVAAPGRWQDMLPPAPELSELPGLSMLDPLDATELGAIDDAIVAGRLDAADVQLTAMEDLHPDEPRLRWRRGRLQVGRKQFERALATYGTAATDAPSLLDEPRFYSELQALLRRPALESAAVGVASERLGHPGHAFLLERLNDLERPLSPADRSRALVAVRRHPECGDRVDPRRQIAQDLRSARSCGAFEGALTAIEADPAAVYLQPVHDVKLPRECKGLRPQLDRVRATLVEAHGAPARRKGKSGRCRGVLGLVRGGC